MNLALAFITAFLVSASDTPYKTIPIKSQGLTTDIFQNIYVHHLQSLQKIDTNGNVLYSFSDAQLGNIHSIDVSNPLQILVFYKETQSLLILNNTLNPLSPVIRFDHLQLYNVKAICASSRGGFWVYDANQTQLMLFNSKLENIYKGTKLFIDNVSEIIEYQNAVYIISENKGYWKFNLKGELIEFISVPDLKKILVYKNQLLYVKESEIEFPNQKKITLPTSSTNVALIKNTLIIAEDEHLKFFRIDYN